MKTRIVLSVIILFSVFAFILSKPSEKNNLSVTVEKQNLLPPSSPTDTFIIGAYQSGLDSRRERLVDTLGFNLWFRYLGGTINGLNGLKIQKGWTDYDKTFDTTIDQSVWNILNENSNTDRPLKTIMHRPNIEWLAFGQRSDYQCEDIVQNQDLNFYRYNEHPRGNDLVDSSIYGGNNVKVRFCKQGQEDSGYVVKGLLANREQIAVHLTYGGVPYPGFGDKQFDWYVKPRIRIDSIDAYNNVNVCRIEVYDFNENIIRNINITGFNFLKNGNYNGSYIDEYDGLDNIYNLIIQGNKSDSSRNIFNPNDSGRFSTNCKVDFRVFWYGECNMWLDYVRVEDDRAHSLFNSTDPKHDLYMSMINAEANLASSNSGTAFTFYTEEFEFNHIPCIKYVYDRLYQQSGIKPSFYGSPGYGWYGDHVNNLYLADLGINHFIHYFIDSLQIKYYIWGDYPFANTVKNPNDPNNIDSSLIPNTLLKTSGNFDAYAVSPGVYDIWLQSYMEDYDKSFPNHWMFGNFIWNLKRMDSLSDRANINFLSPIQVHSLNGGGDGNLREPTNEEIEMMVNTSLTYGSKGIIYNQYISWGTRSDYINKLPFSRGLIDDTVNFDNIHPRYINDYGQYKWQKIIDINKKLKKWASYLMSFNNANTNSYIYRNEAERYGLIDNSYLLQMQSLRPGTGSVPCNYDNIPQGYIPECQEDTYLQVATFENNEPNTKYFMVVNRRCSPFVNESNEDNRGGKRKVRASLHSDYSAFSAFKNWSVVNCENDSIVAVFKTHNPYYLELGWFMPGEGKLYKIVPNK